MAFLNLDAAAPAARTPDLRPLARRVRQIAVALAAARPAPRHTAPQDLLDARARREDARRAADRLLR